MSRLKWTNISGTSLIFLTLSIFSGVVSKPCLTTNTVKPHEGNPFSLSCSTGLDLVKVYWIRNADILFITQSGQNDTSFDIETNSDVFEVVSGRFTVNASVRQHKVKLWINSTLDDGSEWRCKVVGLISNTIVIQVTKDTTVRPGSTSKGTTATFAELSSTNSILTTASHSIAKTNKTNAVTTEKSSKQDGNKTDTASPVTEGASNQNEKLIYIIAASAGGGVVVIVIVIVVVVCVVCVRKKRTQDTPTKNTSQDGLHPALESQHDNNETEMVDNALYSSGYMDHDYSTVDAYTNTAGSKAEVSDDTRVTEMVDNALYSSGYMDHDYSTVDAYTNTAGSKAEVSDDTRVTDVYAQVQKKKDKTEVQVTVNIEDLYAKPFKKKKGGLSISVQNNVNISIGQIADEDV